MKLTMENNMGFQDLNEALEKKECRVIKDFIEFADPGNSLVYALKEPIPIGLIQKRITDFDMLFGKKRNLQLNDFNLGLNVVIIDGDELDKEGLHVHLSHIIAIIFDGQGILEWESKDGVKHKDLATKGDCVVVPRGVMHYFTGKLSFAALEISDIIDYQKHHHTDIE